MSVKETIEQKLTYHFKPSKLIVTDESADHIGHSGYVQGGETHFSVFLRSKKFKGKTRLDRQRAVYRILQTEIKETIHALALDLGE